MADEVTAVSIAVKTELESSYGVLCPKLVHVIANGVNQTDLSDKKQSRIIFLATAFRNRKGIWELLNAFSLLEQTDLQLVIAGAGRGYENRIRREINILGIEDRVQLLGEISNAETLDWLSICEVFCLPSLMEGHPLVLLEAMSVGAAIVATDIGGVNETIQTGVNGILVPPGNVIKLQAALSDLISQPDLRKKLGIAACKTVMEKYQWDSQGEKYLKIFHKDSPRIDNIL